MAVTTKRRVNLLTLPTRLIEGFFSLFDIVLVPLQRFIGPRRMGLFFVLPNLIIFGVFILLPMLLNFVYAFTSGQSILLENRPAAGLDNFSTLLTCGDYTNARTCSEDIFWRALGNTALYVVFEVGAMIFISLITALALNRKIRARGFFRSIFFYPVLLSPVVVALIWKWILQTDSGVLNSIITGLGGQKVAWMVDPTWAMFWVIVIGVWAQMGFYTLILLAGLQSIPKDLYEAAATEGANGWQTFIGITLPLLTSTMTVVLVLSVIRAVQVFDHVYVLTGGGPGTATTFMVQYIFKTGFTDTRWGIAAAAALVLAVILFIMTVIQLRVRRGSLTPEAEME